MMDNKQPLALQVHYILMFLLIAGVSDGQSVQIAIIRSENKTILNVNHRNKSLQAGVVMLTKYSNKPWINPEKGNILFNGHNIKCLLH